KGSNITSCSPFTATVICMMFDPSGETSAKWYKPKYNDGNDGLPNAFYQMHNGFSMTGARYQHVLSLGYKKPSHVNEWAGSSVFFNLGYEIDPKDTRRGDMVGIDWNPGHGGHAVFCWDVHLNDKQEVDAFQYVSANGHMKPDNHGPGVTVSAYHWEK